jgi:4'-phosphopantetheinyl transferase
VAFSYTATGKPELAGLDASLQFNLAHSDALALYAVTLRGSVGIDIERLRSIPDAEQIAASWFSGREQAELSDMPVERRTKAFLAGWTRKEAYLKACGRGISEELSQVEVSLAPDEPARLRSLGGETRAVAQWSLEDLRPDPVTSARWRCKRAG